MHSPHAENDLRELEQRLTGWRPGTEGLDSDAMLFAAGLAAGRSKRSRSLLPAACGILAALSVAAVMWAFAERTECRQLMAQLRDLDAEKNMHARMTPMDFPAKAYVPSTGDFLHLRRQMEQDPSQWLATVPVSETNPAPTRSKTLKFSQRDTVFD